MGHCTHGTETLRSLRHGTVEQGPKACGRGRKAGGVEMMWMSFLLMAFALSGDTDRYVQLVASEQTQGCHIYNVAFESCPKGYSQAPPEFTWQVIPEGAIEVNPAFFDTRKPRKMR